ncbi:vWA domain-containing protein [Cellulosimicrobium sp. CpK407]|uniref:vWA domain-containing protein n=1 Tax=Cellulosimicrobium sp. CpK407 TaxID=3229847 RepID=UPI003F33DFF8
MLSTADRVAAAKLWVISNGTGTAGLPYLAHALYALVLVESDATGRISADASWRLYVDPMWVATVEVGEIGRELVHLTWHLLMDHASRASGTGVGADHARHWHTSAEVVVTETLGPDLTPGTTAREAASARAGRLRGVRAGRSVEEYYAVVSRLPAVRLAHDAGGVDPPCGCGSCCDGVARPGDLPADADVGRVDAASAGLVRRLVAIDHQAWAAEQGRRPGAAGRWAREILEPTVAWEPLLARAVRRAVGWTAGRREPTWSRPSRRASSTPGILRPGWRRPVPRVAIVVDTSASVDDRLLGRAMGEVDAALAGIGVPGAAVTVYACDSAVNAVARVRRAADATLVGGGGTDLRVGIRAAAEARPRPDVVCVFTDGLTPWPGAPPPGVAVVAAMLGRPGRPTPPSPGWALRVECLLPG